MMIYSFTFYFSSIKVSKLASLDIPEKAFTFYFSSIKDLSPSYLSIDKPHLHSTLVLLKI